MGDTFHQTAVAHKHISEVIDNLMARLVKLRRQRAFRYRQSDGICQALPQRTSGGFNARRLANLRVAWGF